MKWIRQWMNDHASGIMLAPYIFFFSSFILIPVIVSVGLSFTYFNTVETPEFVGLKNYIYLLTNDSVFMQKVLPNTLVYAICVGAGGYILSFFMAWSLAQLTKTPRTILAIILYSPSLTGGVLLMKWKTA